MNTLRWLLISVMFFAAPLAPRAIATKTYIYAENEIPTTAEVAAQLQIPTDEKTWNQCCHHIDCVEANVTILGWLNKDEALVQFDNGKPIPVVKESIHPSTNGKSYYCTSEQQKPTKENIRCAFIARPDYAKN